MDAEITNKIHITIVHSIQFQTYPARSPIDRSEMINIPPDRNTVLYLPFFFRSILLWNNRRL